LIQYFQVEEVKKQANWPKRRHWAEIKKPRLLIGGRGYLSGNEKETSSDVA
jgi:hypothetical protein